MSEYNGYPNYETWAMSLWIDNDEGSYDYARSLACDVIRNSVHHIVDLSDALKEWQEESMPLSDASVFLDLLLSAFERVDWRHIAENLLAEVDEELEADG